MFTFNKWDIVYPMRYPEAIKCACGGYLTVEPLQRCIHCGKHVKITNIIAKVRPMILWIGKTSWYRSMTFGIPLSSSYYISDNLNEMLDINMCIFHDRKYERVMRAVICQSTRVDGNVLRNKDRVGVVNDVLIRKRIEDKLFQWLFGTN